MIYKILYINIITNSDTVDTWNEHSTVIYK